MDGARFVGRDAAFIRLAPALELAASGAATAVLVDGPGGVRGQPVRDRRSRGAPRPSASPFTVIRGRSFRPGSDDPYGAIVRALRPVFRGLGRPELVRLVGPAVEDLAASSRRSRAARQRRGAARPGRRHGTGAAPGSRPRGASSASSAGSRRDGRSLVVLEDLHDADAGTRALGHLPQPRPAPPPRLLHRHMGPDELDRDHPLSATLAEATGGEGSRPSGSGSTVRARRARGRWSRRSRASGRWARRWCSSPNGRGACRSSPRSSSRRAREVSDASLTTRSTTW
jgi:hypothetical protein